jgi:hypothetical protein
LQKRTLEITLGKRWKIGWRALDWRWKQRRKERATSLKKSVRASHTITYTHERKENEKEKERAISHPEHGTPQTLSRLAQQKGHTFP